MQDEELFKKFETINSNFQLLQDRIDKLEELLQELTEDFNIHEDHHNR